MTSRSARPWLRRRERGASVSERGMKRVLICGHRAFAARGLRDVLGAAGHHVTEFSRGPAGRQGSVVTGPVEELHENPFLDPSYDTVINYIVLKGETVERNLEYLASLAALCRARSVQHLIHISSMSLYEDMERLVREESPAKTDPARSGPYAALKVAADLYLERNLPAPARLSLVRPAFVIGEGLTDSTGSTAFPLSREILALLGRPGRQRPLICRAVMNEALARLVGGPPAGSLEILLFVDPRSPTCEEYLEEALRARGEKKRVISLPLLLWAPLLLAREAARGPAGPPPARLPASLAPLLDLPVPHFLECFYVMPSSLCNLACRFCGYRRAGGHRLLMDTGLFRSIVTGASAFGFDRFELTPVAGEIFMDPDLPAKLQFLEEHPGVSDYSFCTNLTITPPRFIESLGTLKKLRWLSVSLYGADEDTFRAATGGGAREFRSFTDSLRRLAAWGGAPGHLEVRVRAGRSFTLERCAPPLREALERLGERGIRIRQPALYMNWGGMVTADELEALGMEPRPGAPERRRPCAYLFFKPAVFPDGQVTACSNADACRAMIIGDAASREPGEIFSTGNRAWMALIRDQAEGRFSDYCRRCTGYRPVGDEHYTYRFHRRPFVTLRDFFSRLAGSVVERRESP